MPYTWEIHAVGLSGNQYAYKGNNHIKILYFFFKLLSQVESFRKKNAISVGTLCIFLLTPFPEARCWSKLIENRDRFLSGKKQEKCIYTQLDKLTCILDHKLKRSDIIWSFTENIGPLYQCLVYNIISC